MNFFINIFFSKFNKSLNSSKKDAFLGIDGIDYEEIQRLPAKYKLFLLDIYNEIYGKSEFPSSWRDTIVPPIAPHIGAILSQYSPYSTMFPLH